MNVAQMLELTPTIGTRYAFRPYKGARRVYELVAVLPEGTASTPERHGCDRFTLRIIEESGFVPEAAYGVGFEIHVEEAWFQNRTDARRLAA